MKEALLELVATLGAEAIQLMYLYVILDYTWGFIFLGMLCHGVRTVWKHVKEKDMVAL